MQKRYLIYNALMRYQDDINTWSQYHNMPRGSGLVDRAPDLQWIYAGSKLERFCRFAARIWTYK